MQHGIRHNQPLLEIIKITYNHLNNEKISYLSNIQEVLDVLTTSFFVPQYTPNDLQKAV